MMETHIATGWVYYKDDWWEVLKEEGKDGLLITLSGQNRHIKVSDLPGWEKDGKPKKTRTKRKSV